MSAKPSVHIFSSNTESLVVESIYPETYIKLLARTVALEGAYNDPMYIASYSNSLAFLQSNQVLAQMYYEPNISKGVFNLYGNANFQDINVNHITINSNIAYSHPVVINQTDNATYLVLNDAIQSWALIGTQSSQYEGSNFALSWIPNSPYSKFSYKDQSSNDVFVINQSNVNPYLQTFAPMGLSVVPNSNYALDTNRPVRFQNRIDITGRNALFTSNAGSRTLVLKEINPVSDHQYTGLGIVNDDMVYQLPSTFLLGHSFRAASSANTSVELMRITSDINNRPNIIIGAPNTTDKALNIGGEVYISSNVGIGTTLPNGVLDIQINPILSMEFPPLALIGNTGTVLYNYYGAGTYNASSSSIYSTSFSAWVAFNKAVNNTSGWISANSVGNLYDATTGVYIGTTTLNGTVYGEWLKIELPTVMKITSHTIHPRTTNITTRNPNTFYVFGSTDNVNWVDLTGAITASDWTSGAISQSWNITNNNYYKYYALVITVCGNTGTSSSRDYVSVCEWVLNGIPAPYTGLTVQNSNINVINNLGVGIGTLTPISAIDTGRVRVYNNNSYGLINLARSDGGMNLYIEGTGTGSTASLRLRNTGGTYATAYEMYDSHRWYSSTTERMRLDFSGNLGIGTATPLQTLHIQGQSLLTSNVFFKDSPKIYGGSNASFSSLEFSTNDGSINLYFGSNQTARDWRFSLQNDRNLTLYDKNTAIWNSGTNVSDRNLKKNIVPTLQNGIQMIQQLNVVDFSWKEDSVLNDGGKVHTGFIAQEVEPLIPDAVYNAPNDTKLVHKEEVVPYLTKALQETVARVSMLEGMIDRLNNEIQELRSRIL